MAWSDLRTEIAEEFIDAQSWVMDDLRKGFALVDQQTKEVQAARDAERWKNIKCDRDAHALRKAQNLRAAHRYLEKNRAAHNARQRERDRAKAAQRRAACR